MDYNSLCFITVSVCMSANHVEPVMLDLTIVYCYTMA